MRRWRSRAGHGWSVRTQLVTIVTIVGTLLVGAGAWLAVVTMHESEDQARRSADFQAGLAAAAITDALAQGQTAMIDLSTRFTVADVLARPGRCQLSFSDVGVFPVGHIDIVLPNGRVPCSSVRAHGAPTGASQAGAAWLRLPRTSRGPAVSAVFTDRLTGQRALAITAPVGTRTGHPDAYAAIVLPLGGLAGGLVRAYGGPREFAFTVRGPDGRDVATPAQAAAGSSLAAADEIVGEHALPSLGWVVSAQQPRAAALAITRTAFRRLAGLAVAAFALLLLLLVAMNRTIARPLRRLTAAAGLGGRHTRLEPVPVSGPAEVRRLAHAFNAMISTRSESETQLSHHALHDLLTGLPNRVLCLDRVSQALRTAGEHPQSVAVMSIDLDRFKHVNASLGYQGGDHVLAEAAVRLREVVAPGDTLARSGGDGFVVSRSDVADVRALDGLAAQVMDTLAQPFVVFGAELTVSASAGLALGRRDVTSDQLVHDADTAMYAAKEAGGGRYRVITDSMRARSSERLNLETDLRGALARGEMHVAYQPVVDLRTGMITGVESLMRWTHGSRVDVPPMVFIPIAEDAGLISALGQFVLERSCRQAAAWQQAGHPLRVAVNVSGLQLHDPNFVSQVAAALHTSDLDPAQLCLELTETILMDDALRISDVLHELKDVGVDLSIDDFGTGYSSLAYLHRFPVDELKVDRYFVQDLTTAPQDESLVAAMVAMAHGLGLSVVAEGVETHAQMTRLVDLGCQAAQGFLLGRPQSAGRVSSLLETGLSDDVLRVVRQRNQISL